jgi:hypothetical protein
VFARHAQRIVGREGGGEQRVLLLGVGQCRGARGARGDVRGGLGGLRVGEFAVKVSL